MDYPQAPPLTPDVFEAVVLAFAETLAAAYRARWAGPMTNAHPGAPTLTPTVSPWMTAKEAALRARCSVKVLYREVNAGRLRVARVGAGRNIRFRAEWVDESLQASVNVR